VSREEAVELRLMKAIGYDAVGLGNHEFDLRPDGLARILGAAYDRGGLPAVIFSSAVFDPDDPDDDSLQAAFDRGLVKRSTVVDAGGLRVGLFAVIGDDAAEVAPFASPVSFRGAVEVAREMVAELDRQGAEIVVCLSHAGLWPDPERSEDELLAKAVPGIDVIVSGHTHTRIVAPRIVGSTVIVSAWEYGKQVGVLDLAVEGGTVNVEGWQAVSVDDAEAGDWLVQGAVDAAIAEIDRSVLAAHGLAYRQPVAETPVDLAMAEDETGLGNLVADALRWYANAAAADPADPQSRFAVAFESNGIIRDAIQRGASGTVAASDLFRVLPLGVGTDGTLGYPLIGVYLTGAEIKKALEVVTSIWPMKGSDYFLQISGLRFAYNPHRVIFDRVTRIDLGSEEEGWTPLDWSRANTRLYRVVANIYNATFLKIVGDYTYHVLDIVPKDRGGQPIADLAAARLDAEAAVTGVQELKSWVGLMEYVKTFADADGDGVPEIPPKYHGKLGRNLREPSWNPVALVANPSWVTWAAIGAAVVALLLVALLVVLVARLARRIRRRRAA
jgi:5'-nucleotidase